VVGEMVLVIPDEAVQRLEGRTVVFVPQDEKEEEKDGKKGETKEKEKVARFEVRDVEVGDLVDGMRRVTAGLKVGERVVTKGSFTLKTQKMKGELGDEH
jgi:multidrug efflux pump subunit AcrA (membrane-fusion protein)